MDNFKDYIPIIITILTGIIALLEKYKNKKLVNENIELKAKINEKI